MGIGATVVLPVPEVTGVSASSCINRDVLYQKCNYNNVTQDVLDALVNSTNTAAVHDLISTPATLNSTSSGGGMEYNGTDLWIYHVSYLWYALAAVAVHITASHVISISASCIGAANSPDTVKGNLVHSVVDRVCCYWSLSCKRIDRGEALEEQHVQQVARPGYPGVKDQHVTQQPMTGPPSYRDYDNHGYITPEDDIAMTKM